MNGKHNYDCGQEDAAMTVLDIGIVVLIVAMVLFGMAAVSSMLVR